MLLHNDIWYSADNICGDHQQIGGSQCNVRQVGCRTASVNQKNVLAEINSGWEVLTRSGYIINCV